MKNEQLGSVKGAARKLGISDSTLKSIMSDKGEKKYSDENLRRVLEKIGAPFPAPPTHHSVSN
jgi:DNA invertase Pin-like site-specific DNA recombinase